MTNLASVEMNRTDKEAEVLNDWFSMKEAIASKHEDGETERFEMECAVASQAIKSNEVIETTREKEQTNRVALDSDCKKYIVKRMTSAMVKTKKMKYRAKMHETSALVKINGYLFKT